MSSSPHPLWRRIIWHPLVPVPFLAFMVHKAWLGQLSPLGWCGIVVQLVWLALSIYDWVTGHRWLDSLYGAPEASHRMISVVALRREALRLDPDLVASAASRAWGVPIGTGPPESTDDFVVGIELTMIVRHAGQTLIVHSLPKPYVDDPEGFAETIGDLRLRKLFREHQAWLACDALDVDESNSEEELRQAYRRLGRLLAELLDEECLLIFVVDTEQAFPINEDTQRALRSDDPLSALQETATVPVTEVPPDDPLMVAAVAKARETWPQFAAAFEARAGDNFSVKAPVTANGNTEFIWLTLTSFEGERIYGELANDPANLGSLKLGSKVSVSLADLNDWIYSDPQGQMVGGFTIEAVQQAALRNRPKDP